MIALRWNQGPMFKKSKSPPDADDKPQTPVMDAVADMAVRIR